ncbi:hypothetical protein Tco_0936347 [Tanacetum coccineum]
MLTTTFLTWLFIPVLLICMLNVETYIEAAKIVVKQGHAPDDITFVARAGLFEAVMDMINNMELPIYVTLDRGSLFFDQTLPYLDLGTCKLRGVGSFALERLIELDLDAGFFVTDCGVGASTAHTWTTLSSSGADDVCVMTSESMDTYSAKTNLKERPPGIVLSAATSFWIPIQPKQIFIFLWDENFTSQCKKWHASQMAVIEETVGPFCVLIGVGALTAHTWTTLSSSGAHDVCVMTSESMDTYSTKTNLKERPPGIVLSAATSLRILRSMLIIY